MPAVVVYEVYKTLKRDVSEEAAMDAVSQLGKTAVIPLDAELALTAAELSLNARLAMADAIVLAAAKKLEGKLVTLDADFEGQPDATVL